MNARHVQPTILLLVLLRRNTLLSLLVDVRVAQGDVVVRRNAVAERREALLDALERSAPALKAVALSIVSDILESGKSHKFFHAWRSSKAVGVQGAMTGVTLVLGMWRDRKSVV